MEYSKNRRSSDTGLQLVTNIVGAGVREMKLLVILCAVAQWVVITGNPLDSCVMGNGRYFNEDNDLDVSQLTGNWYALYITPKNITDVFSCWIATLELNPDGSLDRKYSYYDQSIQQRHSSRGTLTQMISRLFHHSYPEDVELDGDYYILATDYKNFAINGGCPKAWKGGRKVIWIDFRSKEPSRAALEAAEGAVQELGLEMSDFADFCADKSHFL